MSGRHSRNKGARVERGIVNALRASGIGAIRVPLSGAAGGRFTGDIVLPLMGRDLCVEVKARAAGFRELYSWLTNRDVLVVKADRQEPLIVLRLSLASGIGAIRVPLSGAAGGRFTGDIVLPLMGRDLCVEVKARAAGFRELYSWLTNRDVLVVKADRQEPLIVLRLSLASGIGAIRVPLSGAAGGRFTGDIVLPLMGRDLCVEVKARAAGFRELYSWLTNRDVLVVKADRQEPLIVLRLSLAAQIAKVAA